MTVLCAAHIETATYELRSTALRSFILDWGDYAIQIYVRSRRHDWGGNRFLRVDRDCMILLALFRSCWNVDCLSAARWHYCGPSTCSPMTMGPIWATCDWVQLVRGDSWDDLFNANWDIRAWSVSGLCEQWLNLKDALQGFVGQRDQGKDLLEALLQSCHKAASNPRLPGYGRSLEPYFSEPALPPKWATSQLTLWSWGVCMCSQEACSFSTAFSSGCRFFRLLLGT